jgi:hypothetical protein
MCDYTEVEYKCGHVRYLVRAWCVVYQQTQQRCPPNVVAKYDFLVAPRPAVTLLNMNVVEFC